MSHCAGDSSPELDGVGRVLAGCGVAHSSRNDRALVQEACELVARRAARLSAVSVAAVAAQMGEDAVGASAAIDGSVYKLYPRFREWMQEALSELSSPVKLTFAEDGSGQGAAIIAVVAAAAAAGKA
jgi:hexokinase